jgi:hypothetical protein
MIKYFFVKKRRILHSACVNIKVSGGAMMTPRERLNAVLNHQQADRVCVDFGAGGQTGMGAGAVHRLRKALFGDDRYRVKIIEPYQMLGEVDEAMRQTLGLDVVGVHPRNNMFGFPNDNWKPFAMHDGTPVHVPGQFNTSLDENGGFLIYPEGDMTVPPSARMPRDSYFFDSIPRQGLIEEGKLNPIDNCEEFTTLSEEDVAHYVREVTAYHQETDYGIYITLPGMAFGDIALVPGPWMKHPKGIRGVEEWYVSTASRRDYILQVFEYQCEIALKNVEILADALGDMVQVAFVSGTDFGTQRGPFCSPKTFRELYAPFYKRINDQIHRLTSWKTFIHSCGGIYPLIPSIIECGFDVLNPVQCSADGMEPKRLKKEFGDDLVFWGGGVDTQNTLPFGTPEEVYNEVRKRIDTFNEGGGFVFTSIHNVQSNVPVENLLTMFKAIQDSYKA